MPEVSARFHFRNGAHPRKSSVIQGPGVHILLIRDMVVNYCNRWFGCETIHPEENLILMNLLQMSCVITWAWSFLIKAKNIISQHTLWHFNSTFGSSLSASSAYQRFNKKWDQLWLSASISRILEPSLQGLISSAK